MQRLLKLRKMSLDEMRFRVRGVLRRRRERLAWRRGNFELSADVRSERVDEVWRCIGELVPGTQCVELQGLQKQRPRYYEALVAQTVGSARRILSGEWPLLGWPVDLRREVDWHRDPRSQYRWELAFYADLPPYGIPEGVDAKYVWELGRQQYVAELARGWLLSGDEDFAERTRALILDWIQKNPVCTGIHWAGALEVAMRVISWLWAIAALREWDGWRAGEREAILGSLCEQAKYLERHLSFYSSPYNHLIGEATALYLVGIALRLHGLGERWRSLGRKVLDRHGPLQFHGDGFCVEQATGYHFYTLGFLSLAVIAARVEAEPMRELEAMVQRAYRAGAAFRQPDGRWPAIGDADSARSIPVHHDDFWDFRSLCSLGAALFKDSFLRSTASEPGEEVYWCLGSRGIDAWETLEPTTEPRVVLPESGYVIAQSADDWMLFDAGPVAGGLHADATPSSAHGHLDTLQVLYVSNGLQILLDPGLPFYAGPREWLRHFRGAAGHNTVEIEGVAPAKSAGPLAWCHAAPRPTLEAELSDDIWLARACAIWSRGTRIERSLLSVPGHGLWVADWIETDVPRRVRWHWQLPAETVRPCTTPAGRTARFDGADAILSVWSSATDLEAAVDLPDVESPIAQEAVGYGVLRPAQHIRCEADVVGSLLVVSYIGRTAAPAAVALRNTRLECFPDGERHLAPRRRSYTFGDVRWEVPAGSPAAIDRSVAKSH